MPITKCKVCGNKTAVMVLEGERIKPFCFACENIKIGQEVERLQSQNAKLMNVVNAVMECEENRKDKGTFGEDGERDMSGSEPDPDDYFKILKAAKEALESDSLEMLATINNAKLHDEAILEERAPEIVCLKEIIEMRHGS
jgi:hypothetical protein